ncbi:MAG TPA: methyltransferase domain-containing protein, partial [Bacillales bacterium]|nr:methyltransferase domain-containing protein [Bacillales bacterium]
MKREELFQILVAEAEKPFSGWDFSYIGETGRMATDSLAWSFASEILFDLRKADALLDMGTGGGEYLSLFQPLPAYTCATEGYPPNVNVAKERLKPLGVHVYPLSPDDKSMKLPFTDATFDFVMNRHEEFSPSEVRRILKEGGRFATQQVGGTDNVELNRRLGESEDFGFADWHLPTAEAQLEDEGFR